MIQTHWNKAFEIETEIENLVRSGQNPDLAQIHQAWSGSVPLLNAGEARVWYQRCDDVEEKDVFQNAETTVVVVLELDEAIQTVVATLANIKELKLRQEEYVHLFIKGKDIIALQYNRV